MMPAPVIIWSPEAPREPAGGPECGLSCRGIWREVSRGDGKGLGRRGWVEECDKPGCPRGAATRKPAPHA